MKYNIISIDDSRASYKQTIRERVELEEVSIPTVNGHEVDLEKELADRGIELLHRGMFSTGELGIWLSAFDCWQWAVDNDEELITFEDDAIPCPTFSREFNTLYKELPDDYDFLCLWVPENQFLDYVYDVVYDEHGAPTHVGPNKNSITSNYNFGSVRLARVYNGYGNVATLYSPKGAKHFIDRIREVGIATPVDCYLYQEAHAGRCAGYGPKPNRAKIVGYDWAAETTVHNDKRY